MVFWCVVFVFEQKSKEKRKECEKQTRNNWSSGFSWVASSILLTLSVKTGLCLLRLIACKSCYKYYLAKKKIGWVASESNW